MSCFTTFHICRKVGTGSPYSTDIQQLLNYVSEICHPHRDATSNHSLSPTNQPLSKSDSVAQTQCSTTLSDDVELKNVDNASRDGQKQISAWDEDEAFWTQAADVVEENWEDSDDGDRDTGDRDSAFIVRLLSSGSIWTPGSHH